MSQRTVLITGCSEGGSGDALAKNFHRKGHRVFATARDLAKVEHLKALGLEVIALDVVDNVSIKSAFETVNAATGGTLDILINNSGIGYDLPLLDSDVSTARKMFDVNVFGVIEVIRTFAPLLIASKGTIINIGSIAGISPVVWQGYYNASKAAIKLLTDQLRLEFSPFNVNAIQVVTGGIRTNFLENLPAKKLPASSLYLPAREEIEEVMSGSMVVNALDVDVYAEKVVKNALKTHPKKNLWVGSSSFGWATIWDTVLPGLVKLPAVKRKIQAAEKSK